MHSLYFIEKKVLHGKTQASNAILRKYRNEKKKTMLHAM